MTITEIVSRLTTHQFRPVEEGFTKEPATGEHGLDDFINDDWRQRTLAVRDFVCLGDTAVPELISLLVHDDMNIRYLAALALGVLEADAAIDALHECLRNDVTSMVRSQAAISLGQIGSIASVSVLEDQARIDDHRDIPPQCTIASQRIRHHKDSERELRLAYEQLDESLFGMMRIGANAPDFELYDVDGNRWRLSEISDKTYVVLIWVFADWCPVCHHEFHDLIASRSEFEDLNTAVVTIECHDSYRARVMAGRESKPAYWYSDRFAGLDYGDERWWPHLVDHAGNVAGQFGADPLAMAVHSEFVNRPSTIIIDENAVIRFAYTGSFWGDRPTVDETLQMLRAKRFDFKHPNRRRS